MKNTLLFFKTTLLLLLLFCSSNIGAQIIVTQASVPNNIADFGIQAPNTVKGKILKIQNTGSVTYTITNVTLSGSVDFSMGTSFTWPTTITPGQQYNVNTYFGSYNPGTHVGQIEIEHNANYCESTFIHLQGIAEGTNCPVAGTSCDDGDATTFFDEENGYCECVGDPCSLIGLGCDDGDSNTYNDVYNEFCNCEGLPCQSAGTACDDGDSNTYNDVLDGSCVCAGTPCPAVGTSCDDGLYYTNNDAFDANCNCVGTVDCSIIELPINGATAGLSYLNNDAPLSLDNDLGTSWYNNHAPTNWIEFTMNQTEAIESIRLIFYNSDVQTYSFDVKIDGAIVYSGISALTSNYQTFNFPITVGDVVRVETACSNSAGTSFFGVTEMEVHGIYCCPAAGTPCNDGNSDTTNDVEDGNCNCYGDCPYLGWGCDDNDPNTNNDVVNVFCECEGNNCPQAGTTCNDGDASTGNDVYDANCNCAGTPCPSSGTACDDNDASTFNDIEDGFCNCVGTPCPAVGTACDDGDACTNNDQEDGNCNCVGTLIDSDNDGVCDTVDQCPGGDDDLDMNNNNLPDECEPEYGTCDNNGGDFDFDNICDDHDSCLITEITNSIVNVYDSGQDAGTYNIWNFRRTIFMENNAWKALEVNYTITANTVIEFEFKSTDEGEIHELTFDDDLNLGSPDGGNARFKLYGTQNVNVNTDYSYNGSGNWQHFTIPVGDFNSPGLYQYLGLTCDDDANDAGNSFFRNIMIYEDADGNGQCDDPCGSVGSACDDGNAATVNDVFDVACNCVGNNCPTAGTVCDDGDPNTLFDQEDGFCNCAGIICDPVGTSCNDNDASTYNDVEDGNCNCTGTPCPTAGTACNDNNASTFDDEEDGFCNCVGTPCPALGTACDDGDPTTGNDIEDGFCNCAGAPCPSAGTACDDNDASTFNDIEDGFCNCVGTPCPTAGTSCNDNDASTFNDVADGFCNCVGTPCPASGTSCDDGDPTTGPDVEDGFCNCSGPPCPTAGTACNDNDASTFNDMEDGNCNCVGTPCPTAGTACNDNDASTFNDQEDGFCNCVGTPCPASGTSCDDGDPTTGPDVEDGNCNCAGPPCPTAGTVCNDNDSSTFNDIQDGNCNCVGTPCPAAGTSCDDNDATTFNDVADGFCNCTGTPCPASGTSCDDNDPSTFNDIADGFCNCVGTPCPTVGTACDDSDASTFNDQEDGNCNCVGTPCPAAGTACNDGDSNTVNDVEDGFCNCAGVICAAPGTPCNDNDASTFNDEEDGLCNCVGTPCPTAGTSCDDNDASTFNDEEDGFCNCVGTPCPVSGTSCDDGDPTTGPDVEDGNCNCAGPPCPVAGTVCNDNDSTTFDDFEDGNCNCVGTPCPAAGTACDDGDPTTGNDVEDGFCNCAGNNCPSAGTACDDNDASTFNDQEDGFCNCVGTPCPAAGTACDDGDPCTINDVEDGNCNCAGTFSDTDGDGVCDANDICPSGDDNLDVNNNGIPDPCDPNIGICDSVGGDFDNDGICDNYDSCLITEITNSMVNVYDSSQDEGTYQIQDNGATIFMENNAWKALEINYSVTANTVIEFDFKSTDEGEIHHIGFDNDLGLEAPGGNNNAMFQVYGFQSTLFNTTYQYSGSGNWEHFVIPIGSVTTAGFYEYLGVTCDDDTNDAGNSYYSNILIYEDANGNGQCDDPCGSVGTPCDDGDATTFNDAFDINCICVGGPCNSAGMPCDDGDSCTLNDTYDSTCNCVGTLQDADNDGVCDSNDLCPGEDDNIDMNNNNQPDACEPGYGQCDSVGGDFDFDGICDDYDSCLITEITNSNVFVYAPNNDNGQFTIYDYGATIMLENNAWKAVEVNYNVTSNTVLEFYFASTDEGEIHEIVLDDDLTSGTPDGNNARFKLYGTQNVSFNTTYQYNGSGNWQYFTIPVGNLYTSGFYKYIGLSCDDDATGTGNSYFANIFLYEDANNDGICDESCLSVGTACDDGDPTTVNDVYDINCVCAGDPCATTGNACDDGDPCTVNDVIDVNCNCVGTFSDVDGDMVCDADDVCPGGNDNLDMNNNGQPDYCEPDYGICDTVGGDFDFDSICDDFDSCLIREITNSIVYSYGGSQDQGTYSIEDYGATILVENNAWKAIDIDYTVTANTVIEFDFKSTEEGEVHEFFFEDNLTLQMPGSNGARFKLYGTQNGGFNTNYQYTDIGNWQHFVIPLGNTALPLAFYDYLLMAADDDANDGGNSYFRNILIYEDPDGNGQCDDPCASVGTACSDGDPATINDAIDINCNCVGQGPALTSTKINLNLEGFYDFATNDMGTELNDVGLVPLTQPFNEAPYFYAGNENVASHTANTVDWVLVMAHDANGNVIGRKACLLHDNSKVVTTAGNETIGWYLYEPYYISVHHKSHLAVINNFLIDDVDVSVDFRLSNVAQGTQQVKVVNGENLLYCGDFDRNGIINNLDYNMWAFDSALVFEYVKWDGDGNGIVNNLDYNLWNSNKSKVGVNYIQF